ncbi:YfiR/HmsC family protein [Hydrogenimonas sp.]
MRHLLLPILLTVSLQAYIYNDSLLLIYAKIVPRTMLLDHTNGDTAREKRLCILYEGSDRFVAEKLKAMILQNLPASMRHSFQAKTVPYSQSPECSDATALMLLDARPRKIARAIEMAGRKRMLTFSYSNTLLREGAVISLSVGKEIHPIVNVMAVKRSALKLDPILFQIAKIYDGSDIK